MDVFSRSRRSEIMAHVRSKNTRPEVELRHLLHAAGYRYRLHIKELPGKPDIVLHRFHTVIQVHGCFWHSHSCIRGKVPSSRQAFWLPKLAANKQRDISNRRELRRLGWNVITIWECQLRGSGMERQINKIISKLNASD
jgi:DNA mismatch endonuclease (patch repair protein)